MHTRLIHELSVVGRRLRTATQLTVLSLIWLTLFVLAWFSTGSGARYGLEPLTMTMVFLGVSLVFSILFCLISKNWFSDVRWLASRVEKTFPDLDSRLLTSLDQLEASDPKQAGFLQHMVLMQTVSHSARYRWDLVVAPSKMLFSQLSAIMGFLLLLAGAILIASEKPLPHTTDPSTLAFIEDSLIPGNTVVELLEVEPGNTEVEKGSSLTVLAKFRSSLPYHAELVYELPPGLDEEATSNLRRIPMSASFDDPVFAGQIENVQQPLTYWVEFEEKESQRYYATVFEYPELQQLDFELDFPAYSGMPNKTINDGRRLSALVGTRVQITARLNKTVEVCELVSPGHPTIQLAASDTGEPVYVGQIQIEFTARYQLKLRDRDQRENRLPPEVQINALQNQPPKIQVTRPSRDVEVSPIEELETAAKMSDDYGIQRGGMTYFLVGKPPVEVVLGSDLSGRADHELSHLMAFEQLGVEPRQIVSYYFWAEDLVADDKIRRVMSDMFFAEIREFDEIFRQGQSQDRQQQQQQQQNRQQPRQMGELLQLQKEIINATWKLIRRETDDVPSEQFDQDISVIQESQQSATELVDRAVQQQNSPQAAALGTEIKSGMNEIILTLQTARDEKSATVLMDAVTREQMVYQMILKLGSNENQVQRQQQPGQNPSSSQQQNRSQQQLQQLELSNDRNRYEQENQAQLREEQQQDDNRQALNRLKELARRQEDINKQLEQLQTALEQARSQQEKDEIERRLKRLREQQEELLRDLDELKEQAEQNQDNQLMRNANEELEKARENVRRSAESLKENEVSQAAAAGKRAQKQFEDLREEFRKNNANQFADQMKDMSEKANELKSRQDEIAEKLKKMDDNPQKSLREKQPRQEVGQELDQQRKKYDSIIEDIKDVVRKAEETEPLLSQQLYDTFRDSTRSNTRDSIDSTENLLSRGFISEARKAEQDANEGISELNERIRKAAESIVGDEVDSLKRAEQTLRKLSEQINSEMKENGVEPGKSGSPGADERDQTEQADRKSADNSSRDQNPDSKRSEQSRKNDSQPQQPRKPDSASNSNPGSQPKDGSGKSRNGEQQTPGNSNANEDGKQDPSRSPQSQSGEQPGEKNGNQGKGGQADSPSNQGQQPPTGRTTQNRPAAAPNPQSPAVRDRMSGMEQLFGPSTGGAPRPLTGDQYRQFSNELRNIEELLDDPEMRAQAAQIREKAKEIRVEMKRHSKQPNWDIVQEFIADPLEKLRADVARQLLLKENREALVPIDRDPVPTIFEDQVREYYKELSEVNN